MQVLLVIDMVFQSNQARMKIRDLLVKSNGSINAWNKYRQVLTWWAFRVPVGYLILSGIFRLASVYLSGSIGMLLGVIFIFMLAMSVASATRLLPLRSKEVPPNDWLEVEVAYQRGE